jgi:hypothetical protein
MLERRKYQRNDLKAFVQYTSSSDTSDIDLRGTMKNYSYSGICLVVSQPLVEGQEIIVKSMGIPSSKRATVRWQENIGKDAYEVGLEYIKIFLGTSQELTSLEKIMRRAAIVLNVVFAFEILFIVIGYIRIFLTQVTTGLWFFWEMFFGVFILITPYTLLITLPSAIYIIFRYFTQNGNRHVTLIVTIAAALNILALLGILAIQYARAT